MIGENAVGTDEGCGPQPYFLLGSRLSLGHSEVSVDGSCNSCQEGRSREEDEETSSPLQVICPGTVVSILKAPFKYDFFIASEPKKTRQKGLQNNSGPKLSKLACVYLFLFAASECSSKVIFPPKATAVSCQQRRTAVKSLQKILV